MSPKLGFAGALRRRGVSIASLAVAAVVVPVAIAFACNPQAHISLDKTSYQPGAAIGVHGSYFPGNTGVAVSGPAGGATATTTAGGGFQTTLQAPSTPGNYTITASRATGGFAAASFTVAAPAAPAAAPQQAAAAPQTQAESPAPTAARTAPRFRTPDVARSQVTSTPDRGGSSNSEGRSNNTGGGSGGGSDSGVTVVSGTPVFAGSAPVAAPAAVASAPATVAATPVARSQRGESRASRSAAAAPAPAEQTALSDLFSNYQPGRTPSLMGDASGAPTGGTGSGLGLGIALLGFGLLALVAGLTAAEARRRRPA